MNPLTSKAIERVENLLRNKNNEAWYVAVGDFPDLEEGPDPDYENKLYSEFKDTIEEVRAKHIEPSQEIDLPDSYWSSLNGVAWKADGSTVACIFMERDDGDTPLILSAGVTDLSAFLSDDDPWGYERKEEE